MTSNFFPTHCYPGTPFTIFPDDRDADADADDGFLRLTPAHSRVKDVRLPRGHPRKRSLFFAPGSYTCVRL